MHDHGHDSAPAGHDHRHTHSHEALHSCDAAPMEELTALMRYMANHNAAHIKELRELAVQLEHTGNAEAFQQVMASVSDFESGNHRLEAVLKSLQEG